MRRGAPQLHGRQGGRPARDLRDPPGRARAGLDLRAFVVVLRVELHFPEAGSLKGKCKELSSLKAQLRTRLGAAVAEVDHHDLWQRATLAVALCAGSQAGAEAAADRVARWLDARCPAGVRIERTIASLTDLGI